MSKRAEEKAVEYQIKTHGPNVMGGASVLSEDEYMRLNMNYDFKAGYEEAEKDLAPIVQTAICLYESWQGGTMDEVRRYIVELGHLVQPIRKGGYND